MDIQDLRYFTTVAKLENVSRAAELLHVSQSFLSKHIAALEAELGTPLFNRNGRNLSLNAAGLCFLESCQTIISETDAAVQAVERLTTGRSSRIRIGTAGIPAGMFDCMAAFKNLHPEAEFDIGCAEDDEEPPDINEYDMIVYPDELRFDKYRGCRFYEEKYFLAVSAKNALAARMTASVKSLDGQSFVFLKNGSGAPEFPYEVCSALAVRMNTPSFVSSRELHRQMIMADIGIGFVPEGSADLYLHGGGIRLLPLMGDRFVRPMKLCFKREKHLSELAGAFKKFVLAYFKLE